MDAKVVCFGEVLFDVYPDAKKIGGAPFNVAGHLSQLGIESSIISRVGDDANGKEILSLVSELNVSSDNIQTDNVYPTGLVSVVLDKKGIPSYDIKENSSWDFIDCSKKDIDLVSESDAFVFGSLAARNEKSKPSLLMLAANSKLNICDLNIRLTYFNKDLITSLLELTHILKINDDEAKLLQEIFGIPEKGFYEGISKKFGIDLIIETKGKHGASAYRSGEVIHVNGVEVVAIDTVGSGDAFLAAFIYYFLDDQKLEDCLTKACELGAFVATQSGAIPKHS